MSRPVPWAKITASAPYVSLIVVEALLDCVQSLVPADPLELTLTALPYPLQGMGEALGMIDVLGKGQQPSAEPALVVGVVLVPLHLDQPAVLHDELEAAAAVTAGARRPGGRPDNTLRQCNAPFLGSSQSLTMEEGRKGGGLRLPTEPPFRSSSFSRMSLSLSECL